MRPATRPPEGDDTLSLAMLVDLYELTMAQAYHAAGPHETATFDLFVRDLPAERPFMLSAGLGPLLETLEELVFGPDDIAYLASTGIFNDAFLAHL